MSGIPVLLYGKNLRNFVPERSKLIAATGLVEALREIKDEEEISQIKNCLKLHFKAIDFMKKVVKPGLTELKWPYNWSVL